VGRAWRWWTTQEVWLRVGLGFELLIGAQVQFYCVGEVGYIERGIITWKCRLSCAVGLLGKILGAGRYRSYILRYCFHSSCCYLYFVIITSGCAHSSACEIDCPHSPVYCGLKNIVEHHLCSYAYRLGLEMGEDILRPFYFGVLVQ
jgi:hypothetical protein